MYLFEAYSNYKTSLMLIMSLASVLLGLSMMVSKNPMFSVLFLMGLFLSMAMYLMLLGLNFMGLSYLLMYVGAISMLFLFMLMLINMSISELLTEGKNSIPLAILAILLFNYAVNQTLPYNVYQSSMMPDVNIMINQLKFYFAMVNQDNNITNLHNLMLLFLLGSISTVKSGVWDGLLAGLSHMSIMGNVLYAGLYIFLMMMSLMLLLAMVGAMVITMNKSNTNSLLFSKDLYMKASKSKNM